MLSAETSDRALLDRTAEGGCSHVIVVVVPVLTCRDVINCVSTTPTPHALPRCGWLLILLGIYRQIWGICLGTSTTLSSRITIHSAIEFFDCCHRIVIFNVPSSNRPHWRS